MTARGEATRSRLIEAARTVVRDVGYANATTRSVAEAAGVSEGTIYRHFPDKLALLMAAARHGNEAIIDSLNELPTRAGSATVEQNLTDALVQLATLRDDVIPLELAIMSDPELAARRSDAFATTPADAVPGPHRPMAQYLRAEQALGRVRADVDVEQAAVLILATLLGAALMSTAIGPAPGREQIAAGVHLAVRGME